MELTEDSIKILIDLKFRKKTLSNLSQLHFCRCHVVRTSLHGLKSVGKTTGFFFGYKSLESKFITKEKKNPFFIPNLLCNKILKDWTHPENTFDFEFMTFYLIQCFWFLNMEVLCQCVRSQV